MRGNAGGSFPKTILAHPYNDRPPPVPSEPSFVLCASCFVRVRSIQPEPNVAPKCFSVCCQIQHRLWAVGFISRMDRLSS
jgi:hypothetical protein